MTLVDLRSDFLSRPYAKMLEAMAEANASDGYFGLRGDPWQDRLEALAAETLGKEDALLFPTCTMANLAALMAWTRPGDGVLGDATNHLAISEAGGHAAIAGLAYRGLEGSFGMSPIANWQAACDAPVDEQRQAIRLFVVENSHNRGSGNALDAGYIDAVGRVAAGAGARLHLDGSRLFNAVVALGETPARLAAGADSVAISLNKGLCAPIGAMLAGPKAFIADALHIRQRLGGGIRPTGMVAAAGLVALETWRDIGRDHEAASQLRDGCRDLPGMDPVDPPVPTNIVILRLDPRWGGAEAFCRCLAAEGVLSIPFGPDCVRFVTYRDITRATIDHALQALVRVAHHI